jgi:hypothetical protein
MCAESPVGLLRIALPNRKENVPLGNLKRVNFAGLYAARFATEELEEAGKKR